MKSREVWASYTEYTLELTRHLRQIAFGGVAIAWLLRGANDRLSNPVLVALGVLCLFFLLDVTQYGVAAWRLRHWAHGEEQRQYDATGTIDGEYDVPRSLDKWPARLFVAKIVVLFGAYIALAVELLRRST